MPPGARQSAESSSHNGVVWVNRTQQSPKTQDMSVVLCDLIASGWAQSSTPVAMAQDLQALLADMHEEVIQQVLEDLKNGDRKARAEAMTLLKQNNVSATAAEGSTLRQLAGKLDFSSMADKVVEFKKPQSEAG